MAISKKEDDIQFGEVTSIESKIDVVWNGGKTDSVTMATVESSVLVQKNQYE